MTRTSISTRTAVAAALLATIALPAHASLEGAPPASRTVDSHRAPGSAAAPPFQPLALDSDQQKTLYALGIALSHDLSRLDLQGSELAYVVQGLQDGILARDPRVKMDDYAAKVEELAAARLAATSAREQAHAAAFLAKMAAQPGATTTTSGIVMIAESTGSGPSPKATDNVRVNYEGSLPDGTVFDSSIQRGEPASFPL